MEFRKDINGLRAWAVILVILFHFKVPGFGGGGIGVDVFFVISGFLMTKIIYKGIFIDNWNWRSLFYFYLARAKRIVPALFFLCLSLIFIGYFFLTFSEYKELSKHVIAALGFFSNIQFWRESGYFDAASHTKFLLHTWSLSVEWQFYILFPVVLILLKNAFAKEKIINLFIVLGFIISLILSIIFTYRTPSASFYLLPTRAWELLAGGLIFIYFRNKFFSSKTQKTLEVSGIFIILGSAIFIEQRNIWPGFLALIPVTGTAFVLAANGQSFLTNHAVAQWLGKTSYSLYLWHWPLAVALVHAGWYGEPLPTITAFLATLLIGWLSWKFIENKSKDLIGRLSVKNGYLLICSSVFMLCLIAASIFLKDGLAFRNQKAFEVYKEKFNKNPQQKDCHVSGLQTVPECIYGNKDLGIIVIGDSHADAVIRSIEKSMQIHEKGVLDWTLSSCQTIVGLKKDDATYRCGDQVSMFLEKQKEINTKIPILIVNRTGGLVSGPTKFEESKFDEKDIKFINKSNKNNKFLRDREILKGITETACSFAKNRKVYMMRPIPEMNEDVPSYMEKEIMRGREYARVSISLDEYYKRHQRVMQAQDEAAEKCGVTLLDPVPYLCSEGRCWGDRDGLPIYYDDDHLNERGGALLIPLFQQIASDIDMAK